MPSDLSEPTTTTTERGGPRWRHGFGFVRAMAAERDRWVLWIPVLFGAGIALYFELPFEPPPMAGLAGIAACGVLLAAVVRWRAPRLVLLAVTVVAVGFTVAQWRTYRVAAPVLAKPYGPAVVVGQVVSVEHRPAGPRVVLDRVVLDRLAAAETPARVRVRLRRGDSVRVGETISVLARLSPPPAPAMPGAYDFQRHAWFARIGGVGFALGHIRPAEDAGRGEGASAAALWLSGLRHRMAERIRAAVPGERGAVAAALIVGDRSAIPRDALEAMRDSGLAHLLAISGLHIGLVAALIFFLVRFGLAAVEFVALRVPIKKWAALAALLGAFGYLLMAGATIPTQRAFVMTGLVLLGIMLDRNAISLRLVAWAAVVILALFPESLMSASFQMSFAAVLALVAVYERLRQPLRNWLAGGGARRKLILYFVGLGISTLVAGTATGLIALHHFGRFSQYGLAANLLAIPITAFWIMPSALVAVILMPLGLESWGLIPMALGIEVMLSVARTVAGWPGAVMHLSAMPMAGLAAIALGGLWLCLWRDRIRWLGVAGLLAGVMSIPLSPKPDILVSDSGRLMALRSADGRLSLSNTRTERFTAKIWLERSGETDIRSWRAVAAAEPGLRCDLLGCRYRNDSRDIAFVRDGRALADDCRPGTVVVSAVPVRRACRDAGLVIDRFDLWRNGGYALWFDGGNVKALSVRAERGDRLWTGRPRPSRKRAVPAKGLGGAGFAAARSNISVSDRRVGPAP
ncbi:MAG: ComEC/Rec2 family competence protein [Alphaproteobacteria bacterium]|nr:ComEC/Rec2 family competence protein [Alphaproteobacteria bacterium]